MAMIFDDLVGLWVSRAANAAFADGYDVAQARGEVAKQGQRTDILPEKKKVPTPADLGLSLKTVLYGG
jgi:hypothetical protein